MPDSVGYWFFSTLFEVEPGEDLNTNPGMYGRQLSSWLREKLEAAGYEECDSFGEDWGWCVTARRGPFELMIGCGVFADASVYDESSSQPDSEDLLWYVFPVVRLPLRERLRMDHDSAEEEVRFSAEVEEFLTGEPDIDLVDEPDGGWSTPPPSDGFREAMRPIPRKPMPVWLSIPLGLIIAASLPIMVLSLIHI